MILRPDDFRPGLHVAIMRSEARREPWEVLCEPRERVADANELEGVPGIVLAFSFPFVAVDYSGAVGRFDVRRVRFMKVSPEYARRAPAREPEQGSDRHYGEPWRRVRRV